MTASPGAPIRVNGWAVFMHPMFLAQVEELLEQVGALRETDPTGYVGRNPTKRLAAIAKLMFEVIPQDPAAAMYRQGDTLGAQHKHWFRAKFFQQYRLFFRYDARARVIIYASVRGAALLAESNATGDRSRSFVGQLGTLSNKVRG